MSSSDKKGSPIKTIITIVFGLAFAFGGYYLSENWHPYFQTHLKETGIPLDLGKTVSMLGMFLVLFPVLKYFYFKPLGDAIHNRTTDLENTFREAEDLRAEMTRLRTEYEQRLAATEASAREQIQAQIKEAQILRQTLMAEAASKADELVRQAQQQIDGERIRVLTELRLEVVNLTLSATERVISENLDTDKNRKLIKDFIDKVEVPR